MRGRRVQCKRDRRPGQLLHLVRAGAVQHAPGRLELHVEEPVRIGPMSLALRWVDPLWRTDGDWFALGRAVLGSKGLEWPPTLQVVWPDSSGDFPDRPGDPRWMFRQPLLAER